MSRSSQLGTTFGAMTAGARRTMPAVLRRKRSAAVVRTLTRLKRALHAIDMRALGPELRQRARAQAVLDELSAIPAAVLVANDRGRYIDANSRATRLTGYSHAELLRMSVWDLTPTPAAEEGRRMWRVFLEKGRMTGKYPLCRKQKRPIVADFRAWANILPGVHVSALATPALIASARGRGARRSPRPRRRRD